MAAPRTPKPKRQHGWAYTGAPPPDTHRDTCAKLNRDRLHRAVYDFFVKNKSRQFLVVNVVADLGFSQAPHENLVFASCERCKWNGWKVSIEVIPAERRRRAYYELYNDEETAAWAFHHEPHTPRYAVQVRGGTGGFSAVKVSLEPVRKAAT